MEELTYVVEAKIVEKTEQMSFVHDENENPNTMLATSSTVLKSRAEAIIHEEDEDSFFDAGSTSFVEARKQLTRPDYLYQETPCATVRNIRKRKAAVISGESTSKIKLTDMPNEILNNIFANLNRRDIFSVGQACYRFYNISANSIHWRNLNMTNKAVLESAFHRLISRRTQNVCLRNGSIQADRALFSREFTLCCLVRLDLTATTFAKAEMLVAILKRCRNLEYLSLESQGILPPEAYNYIAENRRLKLLNLTNCKEIPAEGLKRIFKNCPLTDISLNFTFLDEAASNVVIDYLPSTVTRVALAGFDNPLFNDVSLIKLVQRLPNLIEFEIDDNNTVSNKLVTVLSQCPNLRKLSMSRCYNVDPYAFTLLRRLRVLNIYGNLSNTGYKYIREQLPKAIVNESHLSTIGRAIDEHHFWGVDIADKY